MKVSPLWSSFLMKEVLSRSKSSPLCRYWEGLFLTGCLLFRFSVFFLLFFFEAQSPLVSSPFVACLELEWKTLGFFLH